MIRKRSLFIVSTVATVVFVSIMIFMASTRDVAMRNMQNQIDAILKKMECQNNECDRYKGADAARDLAIVNSQIDELEKNCDCKKK